MSYQETMSKTTLRRTLAAMNAEQMASLITELYEARPEAREYLDFFVQPDIDRRLEKARANIRKEINRQSRGRNRGRITRIRRFIKDISSLNPGAEPTVDIMVYAVETACEVGADQWIKETTQRAVGRLLAETVRYADENGLLDMALPRLKKAVESLPSSWFRAGDFKRLMRESLKDAVESIGQ